MPHGTVVLLGSLPIERFVLDLLVPEFDFSFEKVKSLGDLPTRNAGDDIVAVLFNPRSLGLESEEALKTVLKAFPKAFPILCHGFADHLDWPELADAGAFHSIPVPFSVAELRQSLGFVWAARQKSKPPRARIAARESVPEARFMAAASVA